MTNPPVVLREALPVEFMNTIWADRNGTHDALADDRGLAQWLSAAAASGCFADLAYRHPALEVAAIDVAVLDEAAPDGAGLGRFQALRDALRVLAAEVTGDPRPVAAGWARDVRVAVSTVNEACAAAPSWSRLAWPAAGEPFRQLVTATGLASSVLARLAEAGAALFGSDQAAQLSACLAPGCVLYFLRDHPRRQWCSDGCGNRARVARHYARHHPPAPVLDGATDGPLNG